MLNICKRLDNADTYILGDIINMLNNTEIELDKD